MKISTKGRYALRLMLDLAMNSDDRCVSVSTISKRQGISNKYLEQIITILSRAGYVESIRGAGGGYRLAKDPSEYTVGDILRLTEGDIYPVACQCDDAETCPRKTYCAALFVWNELSDAINEVVDKYTLADLVNKQYELLDEDEQAERQ